MNRRTAIQWLGLSFAASGFPARLAVRRTHLARIGLELYSVRDAMRRDPERTLAAVRAIGYDDVELLWSFGNFGRTTEQVLASLKGVGLKAPSAHIAPETLTQDWVHSLATAKLLGHEYLIVPSLPAASTQTLDGWREWADRFNVAGAAARSAGIWLAFHNEPEHMKPVEGQVPYDVFVQRTDPALVRLQLDVGNMVMGGGDPMLYLSKYRERYWSFHLKDIVADRSHDTELGAGTVNLEAILSAIPAINRKPCYVEQEGPADPLASVAKDYRFLKAMEF